MAGHVRRGNSRCKAPVWSPEIARQLTHEFAPAAAVPRRGTAGQIPVLPPSEILTIYARMLIPQIRDWHKTHATDQ